QPPADTPAWILISTGLGAAVGAIIALIGAGIALRGVRLTATTSWREAQIERQHESLLGSTTPPTPPEPPILITHGAAYA
ncbi:hypothetical protein AB0I10_38800, partial [Streptomyces sp. NPDC050636]|uniref:hypothetical protein n=1 Tax=Streptomyces sp. NPDC050636 TaxID=3154510 RepID=UPI00342E99B8